MSDTRERSMGWEIARDLEKAKKTIGERFRPEKRQIMGALWGTLALFIVFLIGCWLAGNPFDATQRIPSGYVQSQGWVGTDEWGIIWFVVLLGFIFEFLDASAGMGFGTALSPLLMILGFHPLQVVPAIMIEQATCGLVGTFLHREFENVEWRLHPMSETIKLWLIIASVGCLAVAFSITAVYAYFKVAKVWIKLYVAILLLMMGVTSIYQGRRDRPYRPRRMWGFAALAGFNKGIGGGGYGPVVTVGGLMSGVPVKSMLAVTAISEGTVSTVAIIVWFAVLASGLHIDFILLPSMMIAAVASGVLAPYMIRVFPEKLWRWVVPSYCLVVCTICFIKIVPQVIQTVGGG